MQTLCLHSSRSTPLRKTLTFYHYLRIEYFQHVRMARLEWGCMTAAKCGLYSMGHAGKSPKALLGLNPRILPLPPWARAGPERGPYEFGLVGSAVKEKGHPAPCGRSGSRRARRTRTIGSESPRLTNTTDYKNIGIQKYYSNRRTDGWQKTTFSFPVTTIYVRNQKDTLFAQPELYLFPSWLLTQKSPIQQAE